MNADQPQSTEGPLRLSNRSRGLFVAFLVELLLPASALVAALIWGLATNIPSGKAPMLFFPCALYATIVPNLCYHRLTTPRWIDITSDGIVVRLLFQERFYAWDRLREICYLQAPTRRFCRGFGSRFVRFTTDNGLSIMMSLRDRDAEAMMLRVGPRSLPRQNWIGKMLARHTKIGLLCQLVALVGGPAVLVLMLWLMHTP